MVHLGVVVVVVVVVLQMVVVLVVAVVVRHQTTPLQILRPVDQEGPFFLRGFVAPVHYPVTGHPGLPVHPEAARTIPGTRKTTPENHVLATNAAGVTENLSGPVAGHFHAQVRRQHLQLVAVV